MTTQSGAVQISARVLEVRHYGRATQLWLACPIVATRTEPGQFVMVAVPAPGFHLRRPLSVHRVRGDRISLLVEARGEGTRAIGEMAVGDAVSINGPLGAAFPLAGVARAVLVGGGIGAAPLQSVAEALAARGAAVSAVFGFRDARHARLLHAFELPDVSVATEDGSVGVRGTVLDALRHAPITSDTVLYACGPLGMLAALQRWAAEHAVAGYASLEAHMACGTGVCHGCVVPTTRGYARVCADGPVFGLSELVFP